MDIGKDLQESYNNGFMDAVKGAILIITEEMEFAKTVNPQMAMGMNQVKMLIEKELK